MSSDHEHEASTSDVLMHAETMLNVMPVALFVIDAAATVVFVNDRLADMIGVPADQLVGTSALEFVDPRDTEFAWSLLNDGPVYDGSVLGPSEIRYVDAIGESHYTQFWAYGAPTEICPDGFIITMTRESTRDVLAAAVSAVAADEPLDSTLRAIATATRAAPLLGIGTMLVVEPTAPTDGERFRVVGPWPLDPDMVNAFGTPWRRCLVQDTASDVMAWDMDSIDARTGAEMANAGLPGAWVRPVSAPNDEVVAVLIVWRRDVEPVSPNQQAHLADVLRLSSLAIAQVTRRTALEEAAHRDALTGVGNRASLNDRIETERLHPGVLFVDLDHFKNVNDTLGHGVGDEVVAKAGRRISEAVRRSDDVYRAGGDEFVVICDPLADDPDGDSLWALGERIVERLAAPFDCDEHRVRISASVGVAAGRVAGVDRTLHDTIAAADRAMYVAKERGRGCVNHADRLD